MTASVSHAKLTRVKNTKYSAILAGVLGLALCSCGIDYSAGAGHSTSATGVSSPTPSAAPTRAGAAGASSARCIPLDGVYMFNYTLTGGTSRPMPFENQVAFHVGVPEPSNDCEQDRIWEDPLCEVHVDRNCVGVDPDDGVSLRTWRLEYLFHQTTDNARVRGGVIVTVQYVDLATPLVAHYDLVAQRVR